jgi:two-component system response regulator AtoC
MNSGDTTKSIIVGEDDAEVRSFLETTLRCRGYKVYPAPDGEEVLSHLRTCEPVSAIVLDIMMPNKDGFETLREIRAVDATVPVIMLSGMSSPLNVVQAMKCGANDFLAKPVDHEDLLRSVEDAIESAAAGALPIEDPLTPSNGDMFFGSNPSMVALRACIAKIAKSDVPILIQGETGTGKEMVARELHGMSSRADKPFVKLNCAAVPSDLMESELFGYERGAFTGASQRKLGLFELANGGTILLDEIGDMDLRLQAKLLQVLQDHEFRRLGASENIRVKIRVIAATHRNLPERIRQNEFREDLYYRLNVFTLMVPSLRERKEDVIGLAQFLIDKHSSETVPPVALTPQLKDALLAYDWPGNIRQLENIIRKLMVLRDPKAIVEELSFLNVGQPAARLPKKAVTPRAVADSDAAAPPVSILEQAALAKDNAEAEAILAALRDTHWNRKRAAARLSIDYKAFLYKMRKLAISERADEISSSV